MVEAGVTEVCTSRPQHVERPFKGCTAGAGVPEVFTCGLYFLLALPAI